MNEKWRSRSSSGSGMVCDIGLSHAAPVKGARALRAAIEICVRRIEHHASVHAIANPLLDIDQDSAEIHEFRLATAKLMAQLILASPRHNRDTAPTHKDHR
jgi:hypothetical protein